VIRQGTAVPVVYRVEQGAVKLTHVTSGGREMIVDLRLPCAFIGAESALLREPSLETATTVGQAELGHWPVLEFVTRFEADREFSLAVSHVLCRQLRQSHFRIAGLGIQGARQRLLDLLSALAESNAFVPDPRGRLALPLRSWEVAELLCVSPFYLSRLWKDLEREGLIIRVKSRVYLAAGLLAGPRLRAAAAGY
jgi:CRP-like cAMP-binding protein